MSPEQLRGAPLDPRSDIYAAGLILYQMCVGRAPYSETGALLIDAILNRPVPPPMKVNGEVSPRLEAVILKALEKDPKKRYQSAREMLRDLEVLDSAVAAPFASHALQLFGVTLLLLIFGLILGLEHRRITGWVERRLHPVPSNKYVAVMPFRSITHDDPAFDQGLGEAVAAKLMEMTAAQPVQVVSPREIRSEHVDDVLDARRKLGVNLAIEGTLQELKGATRVNLELVDAATRRLLRASSFSVSAGDAFALQDRIIEQAVETLEIEMHKGLGDEGHGTTNPEAFHLFTRGVGLLQNQSSPEDIDNGILQLQQATGLDPGYAAAHAELGIGYLIKYLIAKDPDLVSLSRQECEKSSSLNGHLAAASICLGRLQLTVGNYEQAASSFRAVIDADPTTDAAYSYLAEAYEKLGRTAQAEEAYKQAIAARPNYALDHDRLAMFYSRRARYGEAAEELKKAIGLAPRVPGYWSSLGGIYYYSGDYEKALDALQHAIELRPSYQAYNNLGNSYFALQRYEDAISAFEQMVALAPQQVNAHGNLARAYYWYPPKKNLARGEYESALKLVNDDLTVNPRNSDAHLLAALYLAMLNRPKDSLLHLNYCLRAGQNEAETLYFAAIIHAVSGQREQAVMWREKAISKGYSVAEIAHTPELADLPPISQQSRPFRYSDNTFKQEGVSHADRSVAGTIDDYLHVDSQVKAGRRQKAGQR
jgi:tetratricopeptide (TPR) repeat protein